MDTHPISKLELRWQEEVFIRRERYLDFIVDGHRLTERIPWRELRMRSWGLDEADERFNRALAKPHRLLELVTRLGQFPSRWWRDALAELLLEMAPWSPDGGCPLFTCPGCSCEYVSARIERKDGFFLWRDFAYRVSASPERQQKIDIDPFYFGEQNYVGTLEWARQELTACCP